MDTITVKDYAPMRTFKSTRMVYQPDKSCQMEELFVHAVDGPEAAAMFNTLASVAFDAYGPKMPRQMSASKARKRKDDGD